MHLGWDVVTVAAGGGGKPIRPVQVESTYTPPAYLLADSSGRLHTAGVDRRPDVGIAISDVRDIIGHPQIVVAGATWPAELVFRARMFNPLAAIGKHLGGAPDVVALPYPDDWPEAKVDEYARLVEQLGVAVEPLPESVALSGYVRALGLVRAEPLVGATGVYSDGRGCLVVAVSGDDEEPTESMGVGIHPDALHDARAADNVVIEVMAAARTIGADTSTVLLTGNVAFNDALRLAFQNHLGHRLQVADHPMHAMVLGATHLLVNDSEDYLEDAGPQGYSGAGQAYSGPAQQPAREAGASRGPEAEAVRGQGGTGPRHSSPGSQVAPAARRSEADGARGPAETSSPRSGSNPSAGSGAPTSAAEGQSVDQGPRHVPSTGQPQPQTPASMQPLQRQPEPMQQQPEMTPRHMDSPPGAPQGQSGSGAPASSGSPTAEGQTRRITQEEIAALAARGAAAATAGHAAQASAAGGAQGGGAGSQPPVAPTEGQTRRISGDDVPIASQSSRSLPPGLAGVGGRFTRPPGTPADDQATAVVGRNPQGGSTGGHGYPGQGSVGPQGSGGNAAGGQDYSGQGGAGQYGSATSGPGAQGYSAQGSGGPGYGGAQGQGAYGAPGSQGQAGSPGSQGPAGVSGSQGPSGPSGSQGPAGASGTQGPSGASGSQGAAGGYGSAPGGYGQQGEYGQPGGGYGYAPAPHGPAGTSSGTPAGQGGSMYGGPMPSTGPQPPYSPSSDRDADQSDQDSSNDGEPKRKGLWGKMKGKR